MTEDKLDKAIAKYETRDAFRNDPVSYLWKFTDKQDIEVVGFICSYFCMGERRQIYKKCGEVVAMMGKHPYQWIMGRGFAHFEADDSCMYRMFTKNDFYNLCDRLHHHYRKVDSLEDALLQMGGMYVETLIGLFNDINGIPKNTKSAVKRISLFLRWMVRQNSEVDMGIWKRLDASKLIIPLDVHVANKSRELGLTTRKSNDMKTAIEISERCKEHFPDDPTKMDFYLFAQSFEEAHPEQAEEPKGKEEITVEHLTLTCLYGFLYANQIACDYVEELRDYAGDMDKEAFKIWKAAQRRVNMYIRKLIQVIGKEKLEFFAEYNLSMDEAVQPKVEALKSCIKSTLDKNNGDDTDFLALISTAQMLVEYSNKFITNTINEFKKYNPELVSLRDWKQTELRDIIRNLSKWCYRKFPCDIDMSKEPEYVKAYLEVNTVFHDRKIVENAIEKANKFIGE